MNDTEFSAQRSAGADEFDTKPLPPLPVAGGAQVRESHPTGSGRFSAWLSTLLRRVEAWIKTRMRGTLLAIVAFAVIAGIASAGWGYGRLVGLWLLVGATAATVVVICSLAGVWTDDEWELVARFADGETARRKLQQYEADAVIAYTEGRITEAELVRVLELGEREGNVWQQ